MQRSDLSTRNPTVGAVWGEFMLRRTLRGHARGITRLAWLFLNLFITSCFSSHTPLYGQCIAAQQAGTDAGAKIAACYNAFPSTGGIIDARGFQGAQTISRDIFNGMTKPVKILFGPAIFRTVLLHLPAGRAGFVLEGCGIGCTIITPANPNQAVLSGNVGTNDGAILGGFTIMAHSSGSRGGAILTSGSRFTTWHDIGYLSNGRGNYDHLFDLTSVGAGAYYHTWDHIIIEGQTGPRTVWKAVGNSRDSSGNFNVGTIKNCYVYLNTGIKTIVDAQRTSSMVIRDSGFEANASATAIIPGFKTLIQGNYFEHNLAHIVGGEAVDGASVFVTISDNNFSTPGTITIPALKGIFAGLIYNNWAVSDNANFAGTSLAVIDNGKGNRVVSGNSIAVPN